MFSYHFHSGKSSLLHSLGFSSLKFLLLDGAALGGSDSAGWWAEGQVHFIREDFLECSFWISSPVSIMSSYVTVLIAFIFFEIIWSHRHGVFPVPPYRHISSVRAESGLPWCVGCRCPVKTVEQMKWGRTWHGEKTMQKGVKANRQEPWRGSSMPHWLLPMYLPAGALSSLLTENRILVYSSILLFSMLLCLHHWPVGSERLAVHANSPSTAIHSFILCIHSYNDCDRWQEYDSRLGGLGAGGPHAADKGRGTRCCKTLLTS